MAPKSRLFSLLTRDHLKLAQSYVREGKKDKALEMYAKAGDYEQAARLAAELGDEPRAIDLYLRATLGATPEGYAGAGAQQAGELLATSGFHKEAIALFELAKAFRQAAESALKLQQPSRAARLYERGRAWSEAALYYRRAGMLQDALRVLELEANRLRQDSRTRRDPAAQESLRKVDLARAEILGKLGKGAEGADLLRDAQPSPKAARLLEEAGRHGEAIEAYLRMGQPEEALRLLAKTDFDRRQAAQIYLRCGRPLDAAHLLATQGLPREAAPAYETAGDWPRAAASWEAAGEGQRAAQAYLRADQPRDAARCFTAAGKPQLAAAAYAKAGDRAAAASSYQKAGQHLDAATHLLALGERVEAAKALIQISAGGPGFVEGTLLLVPLLVDEGLLDDALRRLRELPPGSGSDPGALERLYWEGRVLEGLGSREAAASSYRQLVSVRRDYRDAERRLAGLAAAPEATRAEAAALPSRPPLPPTVAQVPRPLAAGSPAVGQRLAGRYDILAELGRGGMGRVYRAHDRELGEEVAIKTLLSVAGDSAIEEERLLREVQICRKITHPNVVRVFDLGRFEGGIFITMELLEGQRLDRLIDPAKPLPLGRVKVLLTEIAAGLQEAHALGIVHRDLKPGNVILTAARAKILDFGIARMAGIDNRLTQTGFAVGSPMYMSPEQLQGATLDG
ncbi:MAG TPA: protein kinase, partial [Thermoanaerobaculia bacterium]|nr:protein kinase [Thermoanaerobaculia bacterium]